MNHVHGAINHFPIALLFVSAGFDLFAGEEVKACASVRGFCWRSVLSGPSHPLSQGWWRTWPTSDPVFASAIEVHQYTAFAATAIFAALAAWRWFSLRRGSDIGGTRAYLASAVLGLIMLGVTGLLGGNLLTEWGIGVEGVTR